ncbi:MAG TPA: FliM/FliN family flagellar motor switch protein [Gaiellaceae bacterium]|jgi:flagellar motor switch protein FliN/FliY|nr:FliM/FliN family flagellar motor switch protein [Gaiellaceae bacterium]
MSAALRQLGESTAEAVAGVLGALAPGEVERGAVTVAGADTDPLAGIRAPVVVASVSYVDGVTGGNLFVIGIAGAKRLAASMMGLSEPEDIEGELSELELSAVSEAANQMMAVAAGATSKVLGEEVEIGVPQTQLLASVEEVEALYEKTPHQAHVAFTIFGESCRLVQLVPNAFVVRMGRAFDQQAGALLVDHDVPGPAVDGGGGDVLRGVSLRVWAELGRATLPVGRAVGLASGSIVELDRAVDDPVDLFVNGRRFASGRLMLADDGEWAVQIDEIADPADASAPASASAGPPIQEGVR